MTGSSKTNSKFNAALRQLLLSGILLSGCLSSFAQKTQKSDTLVLHKEKYPNGKISAYSYILNSTGNGKAVCYDPQGKIMYQGEVSRNHGHRSVYFQHHPNKVVSKIELSSAPDGGIQWYRTYLFFNEQGVLVNKIEDNWDDRVTVLTDPGPGKKEEKPTPKQEVVECAVTYSNEAWLVNQTPHPIHVKWIARRDTITKTIQPRDTVFIANLIQAQFFADPYKSASVVVKKVKGKPSKGVRYELIPLSEKQEGKEKKLYYYRVLAVLAE
ncbi:MAG: hypothetical protein ACK40M_14120, partial [Flavobacteriales bacterium]